MAVHSIFSVMPVWATLALAGFAETARGAEAWPGVRGNSSLQGIAESPVIPPLKLSWSVPGGKPILATPVSDGERV